MTKQPRSYDCIAKDWIDRCVHGADPVYNGDGHYGDRMFVSGASIYSYGTHFDMGRVLYSGKGKNRKPHTILVNGERASNTTTKHQGYVRSAAQRSGLPNVIIPFGALDAAGIDYDSIKVLKADSDKHLPIHHAQTNPPRHVTYVKGKTVVKGEWSPEQVQRWNDWHDWSKHQDALDKARQLVEYGIAEWNAVMDGTKEEAGYWLKELPRTYRELTELESMDAPDDLGKPNGYVGNGVYRGHMPDRLIETGETVEGYVTDSYTMFSGALDDGRQGQALRDGLTFVTPDDDGVWRWTTTRHILGESLIEADVRATRQRTCTKCAGKGWSAGEPANLRSYVGRQDIDWRYVSREADAPVAATFRRVPMPTTLPTSLSWEYRERAWMDLIEPVHGIFPLPAEHYTCRGCSGRGKVTQRYLRRGVKFLSGFDHGEPHLAYFFCELPKCDATTVDEAYEVLKPVTVQLAESMGRDVKRQGDIFAVATTETTTALKKRMKKFGRRNGDPVQRTASMLLGTNHQGTEVIETNDGTIYARGCLWHVPDGRTNDHVRVKLGKAWHIIVKNTVPVRRG